MITNYYTYYSYEEWGRGYIGSRGSKVPPEQDTKYMGSYRDKTFKPTQKIILQTYNTREEALADEILLQHFFKVVSNPHFANRSYQTSTKFSYVMSSEEAKLVALNRESNMTEETRTKLSKLRKESASFHHKNRTLEQKKEISRKISEHAKKVHQNRTQEERSEIARKGRASMTPEKRRECGLKASRSMTPEQRSETTKRINAQKWKCTVTGYTSSIQGLTRYQKKRGIDTFKRIRLS